MFIKLVFVAFVLNVTCALEPSVWAQEPACQALFISPKLQRYYRYRNIGNHEVSWADLAKDSTDSVGNTYYWFRSYQSSEPGLIYKVTPDQKVFSFDGNGKQRYHEYSLCDSVGSRSFIYTWGYYTYDGYGYKELLGSLRLCHRVTSWAMNDTTRPDLAQPDAYHYIIDSLGLIMIQSEGGQLQTIYEVVAVLFDGKLIGDQTVSVTEPESADAVPLSVRWDGEEYVIENRSANAFRMFLYNLLGQQVWTSSLRENASVALPLSSLTVGSQPRYLLVSDAVTGTIMYSSAVSPITR
jgi:hypothetical protein